MAKDWSSRFKATERSPRRWAPWLLIVLIPTALGPWWMRLALTAVVVAIIAMAVGRRGKPGSM